MRLLSPFFSIGAVVVSILTELDLFEASIEGVTDPRFGWQARHFLIDILFIGLCSILSGGDGYDDMEFFGNERKDWFMKYLELPFGIPSESTFRRVFEGLDPKEFSEALNRFASYLGSMGSASTPEHIALDGKSARRSFCSDDEGNKTDMLHTVSAYDTKTGLCLGQVSTSNKSNEITAIPELLTLLDISGSIVTIDAMGCQKRISTSIRAGKADYILALKENHAELFKSVEKVFSTIEDLHLVESPLVFHEVDKGHGRIEQRSYLAIEKETLWGDSSEWCDFQTIVMVQATREQKGQISVSRRYYISSLEPDSRLLAYGIRKHCGIESMHWLLDVVFREDYSRTRTKNGQANMKILRRWALNILKANKKQKVSMKKKRWNAAMDVNYLEELLFQSNVLPS